MKDYVLEVLLDYVERVPVELEYVLYLRDLVQGGRYFKSFGCGEYVIEVVKSSNDVVAVTINRDGIELTEDFKTSSERDRLFLVTDIDGLNIAKIVNEEDGSSTYFDFRASAVYQKDEEEEGSDCCRFDLNEGFVVYDVDGDGVRISLVNYRAGSEVTLPYNAEDRVKVIEADSKRLFEEWVRLSEGARVPKPLARLYK